MPSRNKLLLLLASARIANLPSVICNVWLGVGLTALIVPAPSEVHNAALLWLMLCGVALYLGGNLLNDWHDRHWDARHRPERALPQGAFPPVLYCGLACLLLIGGIGFAACAHPWSAVVAGGLVASILGYTRWHKRHAASVILMGLCRALLPMLALVGPLVHSLSRGDWLTSLWCLLPSLALWLYLAGLSLRARGEAVPVEPASEVVPVVWLCLAGPLMLSPLLASGKWSVIGSGLVPLAVWALWTTLALTRYRRPMGRQVSALLAGLPLLDWILLLPIGVPGLHTPHPGLLSAVSLLLPPLAFLAALALQRLSPAT